MSGTVKRDGRRDGHRDGRRPGNRDGRRPGNRDGRGGFTLIEVLIVALIISILAALIQPRLQKVILKARAAEAVSSLEAVKVAVLNYQANNHTWPTDVNRGIVPPGLAEYLPSGFNFTPEHYTIDYDNWVGQSGRSFIGLSIITDEPELGQEMVALLGSNAWTNGTDRFTWVIQWVD